jgi:hypothetical protein
MRTMLRKPLSITTLESICGYKFRRITDFVCEHTIITSRLQLICVTRGICMLGTVLEGNSSIPQRPSTWAILYVVGTWYMSNDPTDGVLVPGLNLIMIILQMKCSCRNFGGISRTFDGTFQNFGKNIMSSKNIRLKTI